MQADVILKELPHGCPPQPLRGARVEGAGGGVAPLVRPRLFTKLQIRKNILLNMINTVQD